METIFIGSAKIICCSSVTSYWIFTLCQILCQLLWGATRLFNEFFEYFLYARHYMKCLSIKIFKSLDKISFKTIQFYASVRPQFINQFFFFFFLATPSACRSSLGQRLNPCHSCNLRHSCNNAEPLTHCSTRKLPEPVFLNPCAKHEAKNFVNNWK